MFNSNMSLLEPILHGILLLHHDVRPHLPVPTPLVCIVYQALG